MEENPVRESVRFVVESPRFVDIDRNRVGEVAGELWNGEWSAPLWNAPVFPEENDVRTVDFFLLATSLDFAFRNFETGEKFQAVYKDEQWGGSYGMFACLKRALEVGVPILDGRYLSDISLEEVKSIFEGSPQIPLLEERWAILQEVGSVLSQKYDGRFRNFAEQHCARLFGEGGFVISLARDFPSYRDSWDYRGKEIIFLKRAQLAAGMLYRRGLIDPSDVDQLTVYADYVLPAGLRDMGILVYHPGLALKVDEGTLLVAGSPEEVEIRANTVYACDLLVEEVNKLRKPNDLPPVTCVELDYVLWSTSRKRKGSPVHLCRTTAY